MGRPSKTLPPGGLKLIRELASNGVSEAVLAKALGMDQVTWRRIRREDPEAREAYAEAKGIEEDRLVSLLMDSARGAPAEYDEAGRMLRAERPPYPPSAMFLLKSRHGYRERGDDDASQKSAVAVSIVLPSAMTREEYLKTVEAKPQAFPSPEAGGRA